MPDALHFLRPGWLIALPVGAALIFFALRAQASGGAWRRVVDRALQPLVLTDADRYSGRRWPLVLALCAWIVATLALAGPTWERLPVPAFRSNEALVVALDLSRSMDAADLPPSRITRAKLKLLSLLERREGGQTGLVVFSSHAFTVTPLTTDTRTIASLVAALTTDIMPSQGSTIEAGLEKAAALLRQSNVTDGRILLLTDATPTADDIGAAADLRAAGIEISVLAIGTEDGAPVPERAGGFMTDRAGNVVIPRTDSRRLAELARTGGGRFSTLTADDSDLELLEPVQPPGEISESDDEIEIADVWRDAGLAFAVLLLPLVALGFRRGWVASIALVCLLVGPPQAAHAQTSQTSQTTSQRVADWWSALWQRPDQRGADAFAAEQPERAAELFNDPEWRAAAQYRAGDYERAAASLSGLDAPDAWYNRGNALARGGELRAAIAEYDRVLELEPDHEDARHNRDLLEKLLEENEPPPQQQAGSGEEQDPSDGQQDGEASDAPQQSAQSDDPGAERPQQADSSQGESADGESNQDGDPGEDDAEQQVASADTSASDGDDGEESEPENAETEQADAGGEATASEDLERWASEQAAEQWLRRIRQDPGGLLRRKFLYQYQRMPVDQDGNVMRDGEEPW